MMSTSRRRGRLALLTAGLVSLSLTACIQIRALTYPQSFVYLDREALRGAMQSMAHHVARIHSLLAPPDQQSIDQAAVVAELEALDGVVATLGTGGSIEADTLPATNHLVIDDHLGDFSDALLRARLQAEADPPNYYLTGQLTGACMACHRWR